MKIICFIFLFFILVGTLSSSSQGTTDVSVFVYKNSETNQNYLNKIYQNINDIYTQTKTNYLTDFSLSIIKFQIKKIINP